MCSKKNHPTLGLSSIYKYFGTRIKRIGRKNTDLFCSSYPFSIFLYKKMRVHNKLSARREILHNNLLNFWRVNLFGRVKTKSTVNYSGK